jgi:hypothetical protein
LLSFPGRHDDQVDALTQGLAWGRRLYAPFLYALFMNRNNDALGAMMAMEVIREIVGFSEELVGRLVLVDAHEPAHVLDRAEA